jgi:hypothetical protein
VALLDFSVGVTLDGEPLSDAERQELLSAVAGGGKIERELGYRADVALA